MNKYDVQSESYKNLLEIMSMYRYRDNPISRKDLCHFLELEDRTVRFLIGKARKRGIPIISDSARSGYFLSYDEADIARFLNREILGKIRDLNETLHALAIHIRPFDPNQITIDEVK